MLIIKREDFVKMPACDWVEGLPYSELIIGAVR